MHLKSRLIFRICVPSKTQKEVSFKHSCSILFVLQSINSTGATELLPAHSGSSYGLYRSRAHGPGISTCPLVCTSQASKTSIENIPSPSRQTFSQGSSSYAEESIKPLKMPSSSFYRQQ